MIKKVDVPIIIVTQVLDYSKNVCTTIINGENTVKNITLRDKRLHCMLRQTDTLKIQKELSRKHDVPIIDLHPEFHKPKMKSNSIRIKQRMRIFCFFG